MGDGDSPGLWGLRGMSPVYGRCSLATPLHSSTTENDRSHTEKTSESHSTSVGIALSTPRIPTHPGLSIQGGGGLLLSNGDKCKDALFEKVCIHINNL